MGRRWQFSWTTDADKGCSGAFSTHCVCCVEGPGTLNIFKNLTFSHVSQLWPYSALPFLLATAYYRHSQGLSASPHWSSMSSLYLWTNKWVINIFRQSFSFFNNCFFGINLSKRVNKERKTSLSPSFLYPCVHLLYRNVSSDATCPNSIL